MAETDMRRRIVVALRPLDAVAVENPARPGTPDINYVEGWVELKWLRRWPRNEATPVLLDHFTKQQRIWLKRRVAHGGKAHVLLQVKREWLLFRGDVAADVLGFLPRKELIQAASVYWQDGLVDEDLRVCLRNSN